MNDEAKALNDTLNLAIKSQEEIREMLLAEIAQIEGHDLSPSRTEATVKFYKTSLEHIRVERESINEKIQRIKQVEYPALQQKLNRLSQQKDAAEARIRHLKKIRQDNILHKLVNQEKGQKYIPRYIEKLKKEMLELLREHDKINRRVTASTEELHQLQKQSLNSKRQLATTSWSSEIEDEAKLHSGPQVRARKRGRGGLKARMSAYLPPDPTRFSPFL